MQLQQLQTETMTKSRQWPADTVPERSRGCSRNPLGSARRGSNPLGVDLPSTAVSGCAAQSRVCCARHCARTHSRRATRAAGLRTPGAGGAAQCLAVVQQPPALAATRHCARAAKGMDSKSIGLCPQGLESPRCRSCQRCARRPLHRDSGVLASDLRPSRCSEQAASLCH